MNDIDGARLDGRSDLAETLKAARKAASLSQAEAAKRASLSRQTISGIERHAAGVEISTLIRLLRVYGYELRVEKATPRPSLNRILRERESDLLARNR